MLLAVEEIQSHGNTFSLMGKNKNYAVIISGKKYACEKDRKGYTIRGDDMSAASISDECYDPFFPRQRDEEKDKRINYDAVPDLASI